MVGLARGGVAVGSGVAASLDLPLLALVVRKIGAPYNRELALGAVSETGCLRLDAETVRATGATQEYIDRTVAEEVEEAKRRQAAYNVGASLQSVQGRTAILIDDGIATGASAVVAVQSLRELQAARVLVAAPVASPRAVAMLERLADGVVVMEAPADFYAVGQFYDDFDQVTDAEVVRDLERAAIRRPMR